MKLAEAKIRAEEEKWRLVICIADELCAQHMNECHSAESKKKTVGHYANLIMAVAILAGVVVAILVAMYKT